MPGDKTCGYLPGNYIEIKDGTRKTVEPDNGSITELDYVKNIRELFRVDNLLAAG
jgi:hypothetical protein